MSLLFGIKTYDYGILVSDSRVVNEKQEIISENFQKLYAYDSAIVGYTGRYSFANGMIQEIVGNIIDDNNNIDKISQILNHNSYKLQKELNNNEWVNFHIIQAYERNLIYRVVDIGKYDYYVKEIFGGDIRHSGISVSNIYPIEISDNPHIMSETFAHIIKEEATKCHFINANIQGLIIDKNGKIQKYF